MFVVCANAVYVLSQVELRSVGWRGVHDLGINVDSIMNLV